MPDNSYEANYTAKNTEGRWSALITMGKISIKSKNTHNNILETK
jgi:hypothetical protein